MIKNSVKAEIINPMLFKSIKKRQMSSISYNSSNSQSYTPLFTTLVTVHFFMI